MKVDGDPGGEVLQLGELNALTDVPGVEVGHWTNSEALTGVSVVLLRGGAVAAVDVRGAAPGTRETDLLEPGNLVQRVQALVLTGGSAFGLDAAGGVMRYLEERGLGQPVGSGKVVPIVPAAVIFDLQVGSSEVRPQAEHGYLAAASADGGRPAVGNVGAGTGARAGGLKGGLGTASALFANGLVVAALAVVNSAGRTHDPLTGELYGRGLGMPEEFAGIGGPAVPQGGPGREDRDYRVLFPSDAPLAGRNTTIGVVATNAVLDKAGARRVAQMAHDGIARAIRPAHSPFDGDTIFAVATGQHELEGPAELARLGSVAADVFSRAIVHGVLAAESVAGLPCYRDAYSRSSEAGGG